jgi:hypothetical protein
MTRHILLSTLLFCSLITFGQKQKEPSPPKAMTKHMQAIEDKNHECVHTTKYSLQQRLTFYPFNHAAQIILVSFDNKPDSNGLIEIGSNKLPMIANTIDYSKLDEIKTITNQQIDTLTGILYNNGYRGRIMIISESCYNPRNAILFIDSIGRTFAFIELCFECGGHRESSDKVQTGEFCNEKYDLLKNFFKSSGIEIGTIRGVGLDLMRQQ